MLCGSALAAGAGAAQAQQLKGSSESLERQNKVAHSHSFTYINTPSEVREFVSKGWLVPVPENRSLLLRGVSFPYARPEVERFVKRLGAQHRAACGEPLVVTSLTRPTTRQPRNASDRSVHPTGMAVDLRYNRNRRCRNWLEDVLLDLERRGVLEATRERHPVHYHVALFPRPYRAYLAGLGDGATPRATRVAKLDPPRPRTSRVAARGNTRVAAADTTRAAAQTRTVDYRPATYRVRPGDSLWSIARSHDTTVRALRRANALRGSRIKPGQRLALPHDS